MDWNKTKTIFIIVFSILNIFLYSLYINRHTQAQSVQLMGETSVEESLKMDNIRIGALPAYNKESSYVSAASATFTKEELEKYKNQKFTITDHTYLRSTMEKAVTIKNSKGDFQFTQFLATHVPNGKDYLLWKVDEEKREATFFQVVDSGPIYFNQNAMLKVYWNSSDEVSHYEQRMFGEFINFNKKKDLLSPLEAINILYSRDYLTHNSTITSVSLGYSTLIQLTKTQVFAPTWRVRVQLKNGEQEDYFINAIEGKVIEFQKEAEKRERQEQEERGMPDAI